MRNIFIRKFKDQIIGLVYYFIGLLLYAWMIMALFPSIKTVKSAYIESMPEQLLKFFGSSGVLSMTKIEGFLSMEFLSLFFVLIIAFYIGSIAGSTMAGAIEKRTIDFQLSQPISRTSFVISETLVGLLGTVILVLLTTISIYLFSLAYNTPLNGNGLIAFAVTATVFLWAFYGVGLLLSSLLKNKITVAAMTVTILMALYVFNAMTRIVEKLGSYEKFTLFNMYNPESLLEKGEVNFSHLTVLIVIFLIGTISSVIIFNRKDL